MRSSTDGELMATPWAPSSHPTRFGDLPQGPWGSARHHAHARRETQYQAVQDGSNTTAFAPDGYSTEYVFDPSTREAAIPAGSHYMHKFAFVVRAKTTKAARAAVKCMMDDMKLSTPIIGTSASIRMGCVCSQVLEQQRVVCTDICCENDTWSSILDSYYVDMEGVDSGVLVAPANLQPARLRRSAKYPVVQRVPCVLNYTRLLTGLSTSCHNPTLFRLTEPPADFVTLVQSGDVRISLKPYVVREIVRAHNALICVPMFETQTQWSQTLTLTSSSHVHVPLYMNNPIVAFLIEVRLNDADASRDGRSLPYVRHVKFVANNSCDLSFGRDETQFLCRYQTDTSTSVLMPVSDSDFHGSPEECLEQLCLRRLSINCSALEHAALDIDVAKAHNQLCRVVVTALSVNTLSVNLFEQLTVGRDMYCKTFS